MARKKRKRKPIPRPVDRGQQLYRGLCILELMKQSSPIYLSTESLSSRLAQWSSRTVLRDLRVLEALGWIAEVRLQGITCWKFLGIKLPEEEESNGDDQSE